MKKVLLTTIIALMTVVGAFAQSTTSADVTVTANVESALTLTPAGVAFGTIQAGQASYLQANSSDVTVETNLGAGAEAGSLQIEGSTGVDVTISWANGTLRDAAEENPIEFTPTVYLGTTQLTSGVDDVELIGGDITLDIGGSLESIVNPGVYSTANAGVPVVFTVSYSSL